MKPGQRRPQRERARRLVDEGLRRARLGDPIRRDARRPARRRRGRGPLTACWKKEVVLRIRARRRGIPRNGADDAGVHRRVSRLLRAPMVLDYFDQTYATGARRVEQLRLLPTGEAKSGGIRIPDPPRLHEWVAPGR